MRNQLRLCSDRVVYMVSASGNKVLNHFHVNNLNVWTFLCNVDLISYRVYMY
jgi:hypothetical protein